jgi:hypothetical protein
VPKCRGGDISVANCQIECRAHNNQRRERTIEEYLTSSDTTDLRPSEPEAVVTPPAEPVDPT